MCRFARGLNETGPPFPIASIRRAMRYRYLSGAVGDTLFAEVKFLAP